MKRLSIGLVLDDSLDRPDGVQQYAPDARPLAYRPKTTLSTT